MAELSPEDWSLLNDWLDQAADLGTEGRRRLLEEVAVSHPHLHVEFGELLEDFEESQELGFLDDPLMDVRNGDNEPVPERVGPYEIISLLGEGGMGRVYLGRQVEGVKRRVAIKTIRPRLKADGVLQRFELEKRTLASLKHPYLAHLYDAGESEQGTPYFAMEYIEGLPINRFCEEESLTVMQKLALFLKVCDAVQFAHVRGIIHRDLKPANVLVVRQGDEIIPKIIDFGIAKAVGVSDLDVAQTMFTNASDKSGLTTPGMALGSLGYMSPEQTRVTDDEVDTRSDVYSLGVILYELLTNALPITVEELKNLYWDQALQLIRERNPPRPSSRISQASNTGRTRWFRSFPSLNKSRTTAPELDWIVMHALEKSKEKRYETVAAFRDDISRFMEGKAVSVGPPNFFYTFHKWISRNRVAFSAMAIVLVTILAGVIAVLISAERARKEAEKSRQITQALQAVFSSVDPVNRGPDTRVIDLMDDFSRDMDKRFASEPLVLAELHHTLGNSYLTLGFFEKAEQHFDEAVNIHQHAGPSRKTALIDNRHQRAWALMGLGRMGEAFTELRTVYQTRRQTLGEEHPDTITALNSLATWQMRQGKYVEALAGFERVYGRRNAELGGLDPLTLNAYANMGSALQRLGRLTEAEAIQRKVLEHRRQVLGEEHPESLDSAYDLAAVLLRLNRLTEGRDVLTENIKKQRLVLGERHPKTLRSKSLLSYYLLRLGDHEEAGALAQETLEGQRATLGEKHPDTLNTFSNLVLFYVATKRPEDALPLARKLVEVKTEVQGLHHPDTFIAYNNFIQVLRRVRNYEEAAEYAGVAVGIAEEVFGKYHQEVFYSNILVGDIHNQAGNHDLAATGYEEALVVYEAGEMNDVDIKLRLQTALCEELIEAGLCLKAERFLEEAIQSHGEHLDHGDPRTEHLQQMLLKVWQARGNEDEAEFFSSIWNLPLS